MSEIEGKRDGITRRGFLRGNWEQRGDVEKSSADEIAARRAEFSRQIAGFVEEKQYGDALDLIRNMRKAETDKLQSDAEPSMAAEVQNEIAFLDELRDHVARLSKKQNTENQELG